MKKITVIGLAFLMCLCLPGCSKKTENINTKNTDSESKIKIVATLFPQYDFAREIVKDKADITLLTDPGVEVHSYEPRTQDIIKVSECDVFVYTGKNMESWADKIISSFEDKNIIVCDVSENVKLLKSDEDDEHHEEKHSHQYDPHIWTSPKNAIVMVENILYAVSKADEKNRDFYKKNADEYIEKLKELDRNFQKISNIKKQDELIFTSRFPFLYFAKEYDFDYESAFDGCSGETEPGVKTMAHLIEEVKEENIKTVYYMEMSDPKITDAVCEQTGAEARLFHSCQNVTKEDFNNKETYLSLMNKNLQALEEGLE